MNNIKRNLKSAIKNRISFNEKTLILFLLTGAISFTAVELKNSQNLIKKDNSYIVNIEEVKEKTSHNDFTKIQLETNENLIFNNSIRSDEKNSSLLNTKLDENKNLSVEADVIIAEISKNGQQDYINGNVEVYGKKADLIIVDEEGLKLNGATFYNTNNVGFVSKNSTIEVGERGLQTKTYGDSSLNLLAKNIEIKGKIGNKDNFNEDINLIAKSETEKGSYIKLSDVASIYGRNILIKAESQDAGIEHKGAILYANNNIVIDNKSGKISFDIKKDENIVAKNDLSLNIDNIDSIKIESTKDKKIKALNDMYIKIYNQTNGKDLEHISKTIGKSFTDYLVDKNKTEEPSINEIVNQITPNKFEIGKNLIFNYTKNSTEEETKINVLDVKKIGEIDEYIKQREKETQFDEAKKEFVEDSNNEDLKLSYQHNATNTKIYKFNDNKAFIIDIAKANGSGISHNYYENLNIKDGNTLLLNNNTKYEGIYSEALKREIKKVNNNLDKSARLIINELDDTNTNPGREKKTEISGNIEVLAKEKADVIFINRNGISINDTKVYNIGQLTFATSTLERELEGEYLFDQAKGDITINNENFEDVDLILDAKKLNIEKDIKVSRFTGNVNDEFKNNHKIFSTEDFKLRINNNFENNSNIEADNISIRANNITNKSNIEARGLTYLYAKENIDNQSKISSDSSITLRSDKKIINNGDISHNKKTSVYGLDKDIYIETQALENKKNIYAVGGLAIKGQTLLNDENAQIHTDRDIRIGLKDLLENKSKITTKKELFIDAKNLKNYKGLYSAKVNINVEENLENTNKALIVAGKDSLTIKAKNIKNDNSSILSFSKFDIEVDEKLENINDSIIKSESFSTDTLKSNKKIINKNSTIQSSGNLNIYTEELENIGEEKTITVENEVKKYERGHIIKESPFKAWFNGYTVEFEIPDEKNYIDIQKSEILSGGNLLIRHKNENKDTNVKNINSAILSKRDLTISGDLENSTTTIEKNAKDILDKIKINLYWNTRSLVNKSSIFNSGTDAYNISLYQALKENKFNLNNNQYLSILRNANIPEIDKVLNLVLGKDWKIKENLSDVNEEATIKYYNLRNTALVSAGRNIFLEFGKVKNTDITSTSDFKGYRDKYDVETFYEKVDGKEYTNNDNFEINAKDHLLKENGIFDKNVNNKYVYTSSSIISEEVKDYKIFEVLNENVSNPIKNNNIRLIGDSYYQYNVIANMLIKLDNDNIGISKEKVADILISSSKEANRLNLKLGKPLTKEEVSKLEKDIIWYVEVEIDGEKVLTPTIYLSNKTMAKLKKENNKTFANIKAGENIVTYRLDEITNKNSSIISNNNTIINTENLSTTAHNDLSANISANNIKINSSKDIFIENTDIVSNEDIDIKAGENIDILASNVDAKENVDLKANEVNIKDKIISSSSSLSLTTGNQTGASLSVATDKTDESISSNIKGKNVNIATSEDVNIVASNIEAKENVNINSKNVNIDSSVSKNVNVLTENNYGNSKGAFTFGDNAIYESVEEKLNKSNIKSSNVNINSKEKIKLSSSNIVAENNVNIKAERDIDIKDKNVKSSKNVETRSIKPLSINSFDQRVEKEESISSNIYSKGNTNVSTKENLNIKGSNIVSNNINLNAENVNVESSDETYKEESNSLSLGIKGNASAGILGVGAEASFDTANDTANAGTTNNYSKRDKNKLRQLSSLSALANGDVGVSLTQENKYVEKTTHNNSKLISGEDINIVAKDNTDIGGANITALNDVNIDTANLSTSKKINETKGVETKKEINLKQTVSTTSSILDTINTLNEIASDATNNELNEGLATLKAIGAATNLLFNDAIGGNSRQSLGINLSKKEEYLAEETKTNINANNVNINANKKNIELNNINISAENNLSLKAKEDILINGGKKINKSKSTEINLEQSINESAGYNVLFGANSQVGTSGSFDVTHESKNSTENILSNINAGSVNIESGKDTTLKSAKVKSRYNANVKTGGNLNIISELDSIDNKKTKVGAGYNASVGAASNTLVAGSLGLNAQAGHIYENGEVLDEQTGIETSGSLNIEVGKDLNLKGAILNSSTKKGSLKVKNNINSEDIYSQSNAGGAIVGASGGKSGELGADIEVGDYKETKEKINSIIGLEKENITANNINDVDINNNILDARETITNKFKKGGTASLSYSVNDTKELYGKIKSNKSKNNKNNEEYVPRTLTQEEKDALFNKAKENAEKRDIQKEASNKIQEISKKAADIPKEHLLDKLNELTYGYDNEKVLKYVEETAKTGNKLTVPDTIDKRKLNKKDKEALGEIFKNISHDDKYTEVRKEIDKSIYDKLVNNKDFREIINKDLSGNKENIKKLYDIVANAKKEAFKEKIDLDIEVPNLVLNDKKDKHLHGHYTEDTVTIGIYPPIKSKKKQDVNKEILNTILHELTHHDQSILAKNKENIQDKSIKESANIFELNQDLYVDTHNHFENYKNQPLEKEAFKSGDDISLALISKTFKSDIDSKKLFEEAKKKFKERDTAKEASKKLEILAKEAKHLPKEHLLDAIEKLAYGNSPEENQALREKSNKEKTKFVRPDTIEGFEGKNVKNLGKILGDIKFDDDYVKLREEINNKISKKLDDNPRFHELMKMKLSGNEKAIKELFEIVEVTKRETLKEVTGIDGRKATLELNTERGPLSTTQGYYDKDVVNANSVPLLSFLRTQKGNNKEILDTIVHELTHHDQAQIVKNKDKDIVDGFKNDARLLALNQSYYINASLGSMLAYKKQPLEREAFLSGHKLGDQLSKLVDKAYKEDKTIKEIIHIPNKNTNLEGDLKDKAKIAENVLIYGLKDGRKELIAAANKKDDKKERVIIADSYIGDLNLGFEFSRLSDFAKKVKDDTVSENDIQNIVDFFDQGASSAISDSRNRINKADKADNEDIIRTLLKNETVKDALVRMATLNEQEKQVLEEIKKNEYVDIDYPKTSDRFTKEENDAIIKYNEIKEKLNETRIDFFAEKTKYIAGKTLDEGGKIYFALDGLMTDSIRYDEKNTKVDIEILKQVFDENNPFYNSVTSKELRFLYENYKNHPNLKFTIKKQVIENPFNQIDIK